MKIISLKSEMKKISDELKAGGKTVGLVPTMGALHEGHISLIGESKKQCGTTVVSIFVNPTQFGPSEDYNKYPRDFKRDSAIAEKEGVDYIFAPEVNEMYDKNHLSYVTVEKLERMMCGKSRPIHFKGVCTVVLKLFNIIKPDKAFFGRKDFQQLVIIKKMVKDLDLDTAIVECEIVREPDGLALSSRNKYLSAPERENAVILYKTILFAESRIRSGEKNIAKIRKECTEMLKSNKFIKKVDYFDIRNLEDLGEVKKITGDMRSLLIACAANIGSTRLIDNKVILL